MKKFLWIDAIGMLDENIIAENIEMKERFARNRRGGIIKRPWRRMAVVAACLAVAVSIGVCVPLIGNVVGDNGEDSGTEQTQGESEDDGETLPLDEEWSVYVPPVINSGVSYFPIGYLVTDCYMHTTSKQGSMLLVEYKEIIYDCKYLSKDCIIVKFEVIKDYYNLIQPQTMVRVPIILDASREQYLQMFEENQQLVIYAEFLGEKCMFYTDDGGRIEVKNLTSDVRILDREILPIKDSRVNWEYIESLCNENELALKKVSDFDTYVNQNMPLWALERNIDILYSWYLENPDYRELGWSYSRRG